MSARRRGVSCSRPVRRLLGGLYFQNGRDAAFKKGIKELPINCRPHHIALAIRGWVVEFHKESDMERIWSLTDDVDPRIRAAWNKHNSKFKPSHGGKE